MFHHNKTQLFCANKIPHHFIFFFPKKSLKISFCVYHQENCQNERFLCQNKMPTNESCSSPLKNFPKQQRDHQKVLCQFCRSKCLSSIGHFLDFSCSTFCYHSKICFSPSKHILVTLVLFLVLLKQYKAFGQDFLLPFPLLLMK